MLFRRPATVAIACLCLLVTAPGGAATPGGIDGRWVVDHQTYGRGSANLVREGRRVCIEIASGDAAARTWPT